METLCDGFLSPANFHAAWEKVASNQGCAGVDGETIAQFAQHAEQKLETLRRSVKAGTYKPLPLRQFFIPKKKEGWRSLAVPTVRDRIVQQALLNVLHPIFDPQFEANSFAYRPGRSHLMAVRQVDHWHQRGYDWLLDADLVDFFGNVAHSRLLAEVSERLQTKALQKVNRGKPNPLKAQAGLAQMVSGLVSGWIGSGVMTAEGLILPDKGVPQGSVISPILSNVYLDDFDEQIAASPFKLVRYADDFVLMGRSEKQLYEAKDLVSELVTDMGLQLHQQKTEVTNFKRGFRFLGHTFVGDLIVQNQKNLEKAAELKGNHSVPERIIHADEISKPTAMQQALFEALKASQKPIPPPLFVVLGFKVREAQPVSINSQELFWRLGMSTLYLVRQGTTLRKEQGRFHVKTQAEDEDPKTMEVPIQEVERVLVFGNVQLTTSAISSCLEAKIPVIFLTQWGDYKGHLWSAEYCDLPIEAAQFKHFGDEAFRLGVARQVVAGKLANCRHLLLRLNRRQNEDSVMEAISRINTIQETIKDLDQAKTIDQLMGHEGTAARYYFAALGALITNEGFKLTERNRRPPKDPVNSLLSFGYVLLFHNVLSLLLAEGMNPYLGNLHGSERKEAFLAFDLMEEFRSPMVDTLVMQLINQKILRPTDFTWPDADGGIYLLEPGKRVFLKQFEARISKAIKHPDSNTEVSYRRVMQLQIQRYKKTLMEGVAYEPFKRVG
jgi:CRISP-associated protein Cas1